MKKMITLVTAVAILFSCDAGRYEDYEGSGDSYGSSEWKAGEGDIADGGGSGSQNGNNQAGRVTAGEWNDLDNWVFWGKLMTGETYSSASSYWSFWTNNRVAVQVTDPQGKPLAGIPVTLSLKRTSFNLWSTCTDNLGRAECWVSLLQKATDVSAESLSLKVQDSEFTPKLTSWDSPNGAVINQVVLENAKEAAPKADIAFLVDATGSMGDEIQFLKDDLMDILEKVRIMQRGVTFSTAALFYRDKGDEYVTRFDNFTTDLNKTISFISKQNASGGGDYPEAVHTALEVGLQSLAWSEDAKTRIAFMLLDAPAHYNNDVILSLQESITAYAAKGIKIIPISASGIDKNTEFMLRFFATVTNGTYVFITNHSGVGGEHIQASVGEYKVEFLNELIIRLIKKYTD